MDSVIARRNLEKARLEMHYTQRKMSELLGISLPAYRRLEKGGTRIINNNYEQAARILEQNLEKMLTEAEEKQPASSLTLSDGRWDVRNELARLQQERADERVAYEKRLEEKDGVIRELLGAIAARDRELKEKDEIINYQNQKIAQYSNNE